VKRLISEDEAAHFLEMLGQKELPPRSDVEAVPLSREFGRLYP
ncbi:hypothetical protein AK812_SmicGene48188, partial [Symbiodinium microadriaticum]